MVSGQSDHPLFSTKLSRRELVERLAAFGVAAPALSALGAAAFAPGSASAQTPTAPLAKPGGTLRYGFWQPLSNLDPQVGGLQIEALINQGIQDRLIGRSRAIQPIIPVSPRPGSRLRTSPPTP